MSNTYCFPVTIGQSAHNEGDGVGVSDGVCVCVGVGVTELVGVIDIEGV